ncbi:MAG: DNA repair protein RecO C-terminal domain-containing protein [Vicingaceae bacterium]
MRYRTILLRKIKYSDRSLIIQTYSREEGNKSFFLGSQHLKGKGRTPMHALSILDIVAKSGKGKLPYVTEVYNSSPFVSVLEDFHKSAILMFTNEVLLKCLADYQEDPELFDFVESALVEFDKSAENHDFHLQLMIGLSRKLGFSPRGDYSSETPYFDLIEGHFSTDQPLHNHFLEGDESRIFSEMLNESSNWSLAEERNNSQRRRLLTALLDYFRIHIAGFHELKSREVLETIMR